MVLKPVIYWRVTGENLGAIAKEASSERFGCRTHLEGQTPSLPLPMVALAQPGMSSSFQA